MKSQLVSVVIPTYNRADVVSAAINSVLQQSYKNIEIIVVDDGSIDDTPQVLSRFGPRIRWLRQNNSGPSIARNIAIEMSKGEIVAFLDSDDLWLPTKIEKQLDILNRAGESITCCLCNTIVSDLYGNKKLSFDIAPLKCSLKEGVWLNALSVLLTRFLVFTQAVAIRREALQKVGGFNEELHILEDHDLALRLSLEGPWAFTQEPLVIYKQKNDGLAHRARKDKVYLYESYIKLLRNLLSNDKVGSAILCKCIQNNLRQILSDLHWFRRCQENTLSMLTLYNAYSLLNRIKSKIFRHSPWFPKMNAVPTDLWRNIRNQSIEWDQ